MHTAYRLIPYLAERVSEVTISYLVWNFWNFLSRPFWSLKWYFTVDFRMRYGLETFSPIFECDIIHVIHVKWSMMFWRGEREQYFNIKMTVFVIFSSLFAEAWTENPRTNYSGIAVYEWLCVCVCEASITKILFDRLSWTFRFKESSNAMSNRKLARINFESNANNLNNFKPTCKHKMSLLCEMERKK